MNSIPIRAVVVPVICGLVATAASQAGETGWRQWGGPNGVFTVEDRELASAWPANGPPQIWNRTLGDGYAPIAVADGLLYTLYRIECDEIVACLDAKSGKTRWEYRYHAQPYDGQSAEFGQGPNASPLILADRLYTIGFTGVLTCLDRRSGSMIWTQDLVADDGRAHHWGYSNSPIAYRDTVIVLTGGEKAGVVGLEPATGKVRWRSRGYATSYASPLVLRLNGRDELVFMTREKVVSISPADGTHLWDHPVVNNCRVNCTSVVPVLDNQLWVATKGVGGTRALRFGRIDEKAIPEQAWFNRKLKVFHWNAVPIGSRLVTSSGGSQPFLVLIDAATGKILEKQRGLGAVNTIRVGHKLLMLDDAGVLALGEVKNDRIEIVSEAKLLDTVTWTPPTLVGDTLYIRDRQRILALDLGKPELQR